MLPRLRRRAGAALLAAAALAGCERGPPPLVAVDIGAARGANVVLITLDTVRADHLGCYGHSPSVTPNLDRLCAQGLRFDNAVTPAPITLPAHTTLFSGLTPAHHGVRYNAEFPRAAHPALAEDLQQAGYRTAAVVSSFVLDRRFGLARGFDDYDDRVVPLRRRGNSLLRNERDAEEVTDAALALLARGGDKPVFLWVHYYDAHAPYAPRQPGTAREPAALYAAEIAQVDAAVGRLLQSPALPPERTLVLVAADHGESLGEHAELTHGLFLYDSTTRIPLLLRLPGQRLAGTHVQGLAGLVDVRASLRSLLGLQPAVGDGIDWLRQSRSPADGIYQEASLPYFDFGFAPLYGWRGATERFVEAPQPEYYDLAADPREQHDRYAELAGAKHSPADRARQRLDGLRLDSPTIPAAAQALEQADPAVTARLRSLGYLGGTPLQSGGELPDPKTQTVLVDLHNEAVRLLDAGQAGAALALLQQARQQAPRSPGVLRLLARAELALDRPDQAETTLRELLSLGQNPDSLILLAQIRVLRADFEAAEALLQQAEQLQPLNGAIAVVRGDIALREGDVEAARRQYRRALEIDPVRSGEQARQRLSPLN